MAIDRRDFIRIIGILSAGTIAGCSPLSQYLPDKNLGLPGTQLISKSDWIALNRLTFGPRPEEITWLSKNGLLAYIEDQLSPENIPDYKIDLLTKRIDVLDLDADVLRNRGDKIFDNFDPDLVLDEFRQATLLRQVYSQHQLQEIMVEFWTDHFNISVQKGDCWFLKVVDDREVIRQHALGNFRDLLGASAHSPAMLVYLDNQENHKDAPNENYARELLELHSLGVDGGYSQEDVMNLACCLTGWKVKDHFWRGELTFDENAHTPGPKVVLGETISPTGRGEIDQVLDLLATHPATAEHIVTKLARRFLADHPPEEIVQQGAAVFQETSGDITSVLRVILLDGFSKFNESTFLKYKRPVNFLVSALRQTGADTNGGPSLQRYLNQMGQPLYAWPTPDGYPDTSSAWNGNLLPRWRFALDLVQKKIKGTKINLDSILESSWVQNPSEFIEYVSMSLLGENLPFSTQTELLQIFGPTLNKNPHQAAELLIAGVLSSPAFQWR
jgi:hypothetical protein